MLVDLFTQDPALEDLFLKEFPKKLMPEQCDANKIDRPHIYSFYDLEYQEVILFLKNRNFEYELKDKEGNRILIAERTPSHELN